jgi:hypothetical protein
MRALFSFRVCLEAFRMIDIQTEDLVEIQKVPDVLPKNGGRKIHLATVYRWLSRGLSGVRLETCCIGARRYTSREALQRFSETVTAVRDGTVLNVPKVNRKRHEQADAELKAAGW